MIMTTFIQSLNHDMQYESSSVKLPFQMNISHMTYTYDSDVIIFV